MISLRQMKTADTAHTRIFANVTRSFPNFGQRKSVGNGVNKCAIQKGVTEVTLKADFQTLC